MIEALLSVLAVIMAIVFIGVMIFLAIEQTKFKRGLKEIQKLLGGCDHDWRFILGSEYHLLCKKCGTLRKK